MAKIKIGAEMKTFQGPGSEKLCRVRITKELADKLDIVPQEDWLYMCLDWMGVFSTQAMVEALVDEPGDKVYAGADVMETAHFTDGCRPNVWKVTDWE